MPFERLLADDDAALSRPVLRPFLLNKEQPYHMLYTTAATNGIDGIAIMPRFGVLDRHGMLAG
jgi:hypothetical protein